MEIRAYMGLVNAFLNQGQSDAANRADHRNADSPFEGPRGGKAITRHRPHQARHERSIARAGDTPQVRACNTS